MGLAQVLLCVAIPYFIPRLTALSRSLISSPLRLAVRFVIDGMSVNGSYVQETRTLTLDRGAHFNKVSSLFNGLKETTPVISGVVVHADNPEGYALMPESGAVAVVDHADDRKVDNGDIYIAAIVPDASKCEFMPVVPTTVTP